MANVKTTPHTELDEIIGDFDIWCKCESRECQRSVNYEQAKAAIIAYISREIAKTRDSERNRVYAELRHFGIKFDGKKLMQLRQEWEENAAKAKGYTRKDDNETQT